MREVKSHESVPRLEACHHDGHVRLGSGMRLDIGVFSLEEFADTVYGELFDLVDHFASPVISCSGIAFGVLVRADRTQGFENLVADIVFRGDELDAHGLPLLLFFDQIENLQVLFHFR